VDSGGSSSWVAAGRGGRGAQSTDVEWERELEDLLVGCESLGGVESDLESVGREALEILGDSPGELSSGLIDACSDGLTDLKSWWGGTLEELDGDGALVLSSWLPYDL